MKEIFEALSPVFQAFLTSILEILLPIALGYAVILINAKIKQAKAALTSEQLSVASHIIRTMVLAAEQSGLSGKIVNEGAAKKQMVISMAEAELKKVGIVLDLDVLSAMIEASVHESFKRIQVSG